MVRVEAEEKLLVAAKEVVAILEDAQGEWSAVTKPYAPAWTHPLKAVVDILNDAIAAAEPKEEA